ncbi:MAG: hypothetical protein K6F00_09995, partial [Lachnospiraceae bacterium]|nr:hypothetical protein [Lachnospiraceae bacterium]
MKKLLKREKAKSMMSRIKINKRSIISAVLVMGMLVQNLPFASIAAKSVKNENILDEEISSLEDLYVFADNCRDSSWSLGRSFRLTKDIILSRDRAVSIPFFAGEFNGDGHSISGILIDEEIGDDVLFSETSNNANIHDLTVVGSISPYNSNENTGGIVGLNSGKIENCMFKGDIKSTYRTGGIAGTNDVSGKIIECSVSGNIEGVSETGGVAGRNRGLIKNCISGANVNTTEQEDEVSVDQLNEITERIKTTGDVNSLSNTTAITDVGGITGYNTGKITGCRNKGNVGYHYVGYNVGGITGRSSGLVTGCINEAEVCGRKDVGGITGQLQPYIQMEYAVDNLEKLRTQINSLETDVNAAGKNTDASVNGVTDDLQELSLLLEKAGKSTDEVVDGGMSYADNLVNQSNGNIKVIRKCAKSLNKSLKDLQKGIDDLENASDALVKETQVLVDSKKLSEDDKAKAENAIDSLQDGMNIISSETNEMQKAVTDLSNDLDKLQKIVDGGGISKDKTVQYTRMLLDDLIEIGKYMGIITNALNTQLIPAYKKISDVVNNNLDEVMDVMPGLTTAINDFTKAQTDVSKAASGLMSDLKNAVDNVADWTSALALITAIAQVLRDSSYMTDLVKGTEELSKASDKLGKELTKFMQAASLTEAERKTVKENHEIIQSAADTISENGAKLQNAINDLLKDMDTVQTEIEKNQGEVDDIKKSITACKKDADRIVSSVTVITNAVNDKVMPSVNVLLDLMQKYSGNSAKVREAVNNMVDAVNAMPATLEELSTISEMLLKKADFELPKIDENTRESAQNLYESLMDANRKMNDVAGGLGNMAGSMSEDVEKISRGLTECLNTLIDAAETMNNPNASLIDRMQDRSLKEMSQKEIESIKNGRLSGCINNGKVEASLNLG